MDKKHILIVEDDADLASLLSERLASAGFAVEVAADGEKALEAAKKEPDLIMLDILLPKLNGLSVLKTIREKSAWGANVSVIIMSNLNPDDNKVINAVSSYSPVFYLVKAEHSLGDIVEKIKSILRPK
jgi:DNA-binding response OmpR family regulator